MEDSIKSLAKAKVNDIHCSPFIYSPYYFVIKGNQVV